MKINIDLKEDEQLRKEVRQLIKGQVVSISREEIRAMIIDVLSLDDTKKLTPKRLEELALIEIKSSIKSVVNDGTTYGENKNELKKMIRVEIKKLLDELLGETRTEIRKQIGSLVSEQVKELIEREASSQIKEYILKALAKVG